MYMHAIVIQTKLIERLNYEELALDVKIELIIFTNFLP